MLEAKYDAYSAWLLLTFSRSRVEVNATAFAVATMGLESSKVDHSLAAIVEIMPCALRATT